MTALSWGLPFGSRQNGTIRASRISGACSLPASSGRTRRAVLQRRRGGDPARAGGQRAGHLAGSRDGPQDGLLDSAAVAQEDDIRREDVEQGLQIARFGRPLERIERGSGL